MTGPPLRLRANHVAHPAGATHGSAGRTTARELRSLSSASTSGSPGQGTFVGALIALTLAACGTPTVEAGQRMTAIAETSTPAPTASPAPSPPAPSPSPPTAVDPSIPPLRPPGMAGPSSEGAAAAASYFVSLFPYINATGDLTEWDALSAPSCEFCSGVRENVVELHESGNRNLGYAQILSAEGTEVDAGRWYSARLSIVIGESTEVNGAGEVVSHHPEERLRITVVMSWSDRWTIDELGETTTPGG